MNVEELINNGWTIEKRFHQEECYYYYRATKEREVLTSQDGITFSGLLNGSWV